MGTAPASAGAGEGGGVGRIRAVYELSGSVEEEARRGARRIAYEQTVELPPGLVPPAIDDRVVGRIESLEASGQDRWRATLTYPAAAASRDLTELLNLLWGNVSLMSGIRLAEVELPPSLLDALGGPAFGIQGIRRRCGAKVRALFCGVLKPLGSSPAELAETATRLALGGADLIKDDHSLTDQSWAPFRERLRRCRAAVGDANARTGGTSLYLPNVSGDPAGLGERLDMAAEEGCAGVLLNAFATGPGTLRQVASRGDLFVLAHPTLAGGFLGREHGVAPDVLLGTLLRAGGADGVIYPNEGGRFAFDQEACRSINRALRRPMGECRPAFPVPAGGIDVERISHWTRAYGRDTIFLVGGSLYAERDLTDATRRLIDELERETYGA